MSHRSSQSSSHFESRSHLHPGRTSWLSLEQQRKRAKELLKRYRAADPAALERFRIYHPNAAFTALGDRPSMQPALSDAQLVIARELGLPSWPQLKAYVERLAVARQAIASGRPVALGADCPTLHLRCGSDIQQSLQIAGFMGDFLEFVDPYCQGPVPPDANQPEFLEKRARFIASAYSIALPDARQRLLREYSRLQQSSTYPRVVLWFEHDSYDQLILVYVLHHYAQTQLPQQLDLICISQFPGIQRFIGLGQLSPEELRLLWEGRQPVTPQQLALGESAWQALTATTPAALADLIQTGTPALPTLAPALRRHLQELPWVSDGLSLTERLTLEILSESDPLRAGQIFERLTQIYEPLPYLGGTMYWQILRQMTQAPILIELEARSSSAPWPQRWLRCSDLGRSLLAGQGHRLQLSQIDRWVGGVCLTAGEPLWCWDHNCDRPALSGSTP